jgi:hypothetical protein
MPQAAQCCNAVTAGARGVPVACKQAGHLRPVTPDEISRTQPNCSCLDGPATAERVFLVRAPLFGNCITLDQAPFA